MCLFVCDVLKILGVFIIINLWLNWIDDFWEYLFVIDEFEVKDLNIFFLRMEFLVVFLFVFVFLRSIILIFVNGFNVIKRNEINLLFYVKKMNFFIYFFNFYK